MTMTKRMRRAIEKDPLSLIVDLMRQQGEAAGREAFFKLVAESNNPDRADQAHQLVEWAAEIFRSLLAGSRSLEIECKFARGDNVSDAPRFLGPGGGSSGLRL